VTSGAGARLGQLHVVLKRARRTIAQGSHPQALSGTAPVRLAFRRKARPGRVSLVVSGRQDGCAGRRWTRRTLRLDGRGLPIDVIATARDVRKGGVAVTVRAAGRQPISDLRARMLDAGGATIATVTRRSPLRTRARLQFAARQPLPAGRYWLLVSANVRGEAGRGVHAATFDLPAGAGAEAVAPDAPRPAPGRRREPSSSRSRSTGRRAAGRATTAPASLPRESATARSCAGPTPSGSAFSRPTARATSR
jgi:hypothetical protein